jgi:AAA domain
MALMVPDSQKSNMNQGESTVYEILSNKLSDDFYVWYEPSLQEGLPYSYFTILSPNFGLLIIAICNFFHYQIDEVDSHNFKLKVQKKIPKTRQIQQPQLTNIQGRRTRTRQHPPQTAEVTEELDILPSPLQALNNLLNPIISKLKEYSILSDSTHQENMIFPVGTCTVMSNITQEQANQNNIYETFSGNQNQVIYKDELELLSNVNRTELVSRLKRIFAVECSFSHLTLEQIETIKGILYPEIAIKQVEIKSANNTYAIIQTLDYRQECIVKEIGTGHRIIYGVAGSGKTLILLSRAKLLANKNPDNYRILILCSNRSLASYLKSLLDNDTQHRKYQKIDVFNFHKWATSLINSPQRLAGLSDDDSDNLLGERLVEKLDKTPLSWKWDAVFVDEAQTFFPSWFKACVSAMKDKDNGDLLIVSDGNQGLYKRTGFTWKSVGIQAVGRTANRRYQLDRNYRNTQEILDSAWSVVSHIQVSNNNQVESEDSELIFPIIEPRSATRNGCLPCLHILPTANQEIQSAITLIQQLRQLGYALRDIAVIYRESTVNNVQCLIQNLQILGMTTYWVTASREMQRQYSFNSQGVRIIGNLDSLGLEFKVVLILFVQDWEFNIPPSSETDSLVCRRLYVAMTRAQEVLHVFGSGNSLLLEALRNSNTFEVTQQQP